jgi:6-phosphogluconolactonase
VTLYVACADSTGSIQQYNVDRESWTATPVGTFTTGVTNSWLTLNASQDRVYAASRTTGTITTMSRNTDSGALTVMDAVEVPMKPPGAGGAGPTGNPATQVVALDPSEQYLLAANFSANYVYVYDLAADGTVGSIVESVNDGLSSHQVVFVPDSAEGSLLVPYRGSDAIVTYRLQDSDGSLTNQAELAVDDDGQDATTGPRHLVFHPTEPTWVYVINEVTGTIDFYIYDDAAGTLSPQDSVSSTPPDYDGTDKFASEIAISPSGEFVYVSNRYSTQGTFTGEGSVGVFAVSPTDGTLNPVEFESSRGALPRHFMLSQDGSTLVVGNQSSNNIAVFSVNTETGALTFRFQRDVCGTPFFVQLIGG